MVFLDVLQVPFGKVVRCPSCMIAVAVAQPQHGIQVSKLKTFELIFQGMPKIGFFVQSDVTHTTNIMQIASCAKCSYQYELVSGNIDSIASEEIGLDYLSDFVLCISLNL